MQDDSKNSGIPTRMIHEGYANLQQAHWDYQEVRDAGEDTKRAQGQLQRAIMAFYELLRPHLKQETGLSDYWEGDLPDYAGWDFDSQGQATEYIQEKGTGVYQTQVHTDAVQIQQQVLTDGGTPQSYDEWHGLLGLSWDSERLIAVRPAHDVNDRFFVKIVRAAVLPLRELDNWQARVTRERASGEGFMAGETTVKTKREFQSPAKLEAAKRLLVEAADQLGALSEFDASTQLTEITREDIDKVEQWRQDQIQ